LHADFSTVRRPSAGIDYVIGRARGLRQSVVGGPGWVYVVLVLAVVASLLLPLLVVTVVMLLT
jgi:hypothetical protein